MGLVVAAVDKSFGDKKAVDKISFVMDRPGVLGLLGSNGAGKTTTIRMILGIIHKDEGRITWNGNPVNRKTVAFGYLPEERGIYPKATVREQVVYFGRLRGLDAATARGAAAEWFERLDVNEYTNSPAEQLSKGNQQKIQLIITLIHNPDLVILDEPFSGLDPLNTDLFKGVIHDLIRQGKYIILSSHQMATVEEFCKEILILKDGRTLLSGNLHGIKQGYGRTRLSVNCNEDISGFIAELGLVVRQQTAQGYEIKINHEDQAYDLLARLVGQRVKIQKFEIREPSLHEIFVDKVGGNQ